MIEQLLKYIKRPLKRERSFSNQHQVRVVAHFSAPTGMKGTPTLFLQMGDRQWAEIMFSPVYAEEFPGAEAVSAELKKIGEGLTSTM
ncbi:hypothetical protein ITP53_18425 [Nonomuraea sp. K274]|uniref:Uncharacterized protein n=1 Tax=Nonomuraea cypriaca TaxID=1187855 RepID=A0A931A7B4_9ACTN|nr:hypothetical protein [Nonomuraea cypriaca]MBF8187676.1 hypothetical protein [Nonomuraea cypriaca]